MKSEVIYFPGLNGLRAIAAIAVVLTHTTLALGEFNLDPHIFGTFQDGNPKGFWLGSYGVRIFFVLSGFLITYLLQVEKEFQPINIKKFYLRRILRIWPLYYLYLTIAVTTIIILNLNLNLTSLYLYIFYTANIPQIIGTTLPFLVHYWSLGVEEQFYLFWPWFNKKNKHYTITIISIVIFAILASKVWLHFYYPNTLFERAIDVTPFHCMLIGALGAILYKKEDKFFLRITDNKLTQGICWFIILLVLLNKYHLASVIDNEIISVVGLVIIIGQIRITNRIINLEVHVLNFLGKISYGIYVIHPLVIFMFAETIGQVNLPAFYKYLVVFIVILGTTILISYFSYTYFEKNFLSLKGRFAAVPGSAGINN